MATDLKNIEKLITDFAERAAAILEQVYISRKKNATGKTLDSIRVATEFDVGVGKASIEIYGSEVFEFIEKGRPPGSKLPPKGALLEWMQVRGIPEAKEFVLRRSIAEKGIEPVPIIAVSITRIKADYRKDLSGKLIRQLSNIFLNNITQGPNTTIK